MTDRKRRTADTLRRVDELLGAQLQAGMPGGVQLANLAAAMAIEQSGAARGSLFVDSGCGLTPAIALEGNLDRTRRPSTAYDRALLRRAERSGRTESSGGQVAAPVLLDGEVRGILYLETRSAETDPEVAALAAGVAERIGTLLRSAGLVDELARRTRNVEILEALGAVLSSGELVERHLVRAVDGALEATHSDEAVLALVGAVGIPVRTIVRGDRPRLGALSERLARDLGDGLPREKIAASLPRPCLFEPFRADLLPSDDRRAVGFLLVRRRRDTAYLEADRSFFRAVAHLLSGALARLDYFKKAAEDPLTATGSRLALQLELAEGRALMLRTGQPLSLLLIDLDRFKEVNDEHGHPVGDDLLREVAALLRSRLRASDSVARYGGDEFVLVLPSTPGGDAVRVAEELADRVREQRFTEKRLRTTLSVGVASCTPESPDTAELLRRADRALYASKQQGRDRVTLAPSPPAARGR